MIRGAVLSGGLSLLVASVSLATIVVPRLYVVNPVNQAELGVTVWLKAGVSRCPPATDVWVRLPRRRGVGPLTRVFLKSIDSAGSLAFLGSLEIKDSENTGHVVGGIPDHPLRDSGGFHGVVFCLAAELVPNAQVSAFYGGVPFSGLDTDEPITFYSGVSVSGFDSDELRITDLNRWLRQIAPPPSKVMKPVVE